MNAQQNKPKSIMFQGTGSSVGKSLLNAAFCRIAYQDGYAVAPFKSQNMALNSYITADGKEMGRAQVTQAECCGLKPAVEMNPVLLKPSSDMGSQIIINGRVWKNLTASDYYVNKQFLLGTVLEAYDKLSKDKDLIVIEGAGSPAEINLRENDIVNMGFAEAVDAPVVLIGDIDKGGVFASLYGTLMLLEPEERERVKGFIINKFRGDVKLLEPGIEMIEEKLKIPCLGVMPYERFNIDDEDSITAQYNTDKQTDLVIGVLRLYHFSNASDFTVFNMYPDVKVEYYDTLQKLKDAKPDLFIIPGSKNPVDDLMRLRKAGMEEEILRIAGETPVIGICGGYQMLGKKIYDPFHVESPVSEIKGLGLLDISTVLAKEKVTVQTSALTHSGIPLEGYEIHMGETQLHGGEKAFLTLEDGRKDGAVDERKRILGTYLHGLFDNDLFRRRLLNDLGYKNETGKDFSSYKEEEYNHLAQVARENLDIEKLYEIAGL